MQHDTIVSQATPAGFSAIAIIRLSGPNSLQIAKKLSETKHNLSHAKPKIRPVFIKGENIDIIPTLTNKNGKQILNHHNQITKNGFYSIINNNQEKEKIAFNYNTSEGITLSLTSEELKEYISKNNISNTNIISSTTTKLKTLIQKQEIGKEYWQIALLLSLLFA